MGEQSKNISIGVVVIVACVIIIYILMFIHPTVGDDGQVLYVRFADIDKITVGTRVNYAGKPIGEVEEIRLLPVERQDAKEVNGYIYSYQLKLVIDSGVKVFNTDQFSARTSGLLGEKSVSIVPLALQPGQVLRELGPKDIIYAYQTGSVEDTIKEFKEVADRFDVVLDAVTETIQEMNKEHLWGKISDVLKNVNDITEALNKPEEWTGMLNNFNDLSGRALQSWDTVDVSLKDIAETASNTRDISVEGKDIAKNLNLAIADAGVIASEGKAIMVSTNQGEGTVGKLLRDDDLYLRITALLSKADTIANDVTHYGLMFHNDKGWQRLRARKMNLLQRLSTPQEFRNYFNDEIDQISTSLSRVSLVLDKTDNGCYPCYPIAENCEFKKVFAELLRGVEGIEDSIKLYNEQLMDSQTQQSELQNCCY